MKLSSRGTVRVHLFITSVVLATLVACGGGGTVPIPPPAASTLSGVAATGAALANASVSITDSSSTSPCEESTITTSALGSYTCTLKAGKVAPFFVVVTDPTGDLPPLVSVQTTTPAPGAALTVNVTPLTTAIMAQLASDGNALTLVTSKTVNPVDLQKVIDNVVLQLANVLASIGAPPGYNPFTTSITAATALGTGNTADQVLDVVKVITDPATGKLALSTVSDPTPIVLATATTAGSAVATPSAGVSTLSQAAQIAAQAFTQCFALPVSQRVLTKDTTLTQAQGGPEVTDVAAACQNLTASTANSAGVRFVSNGYSAGQFFYGILTDDTMTGAKFSVPEIMAFYPADITQTPPAAGAYDQAILNIKYVDANSNPGNLITIARDIPASSSTTRPTTWWLVGNQQPADITLRTIFRRIEQLNPAVNIGTAPKRISTYQTGMQFLINPRGPGSVNAFGQVLSRVRVSGPGLPGNGAAGTGLVFGTSTGAQNSMDLFNKSGVVTVGSIGQQCGNSSTSNCPNFWISRTAGLSGASATTLAANVVALTWAQPGDGTDPALFVKGAKYKFELFYGTNTSPLNPYRKTLLSDLVPAIQGGNLPWNSLGPKSIAALDPSGSLAGAQTALPVDWLQNIAAQQIGGVNAVFDSASLSFGPTKFVPRGALSAILDNTTVPAFSATTANRTLLFNYRMLDNSNKSAAYQYN